MLEHGDVAALEPVDTGQCQCEHNTYNPFIMGGPVYHMVRCEDKPSVVVTKKKEDEHGQKGAMSLCNKHLLAFIKKYGAGVMNYRLESMEAWHEEQSKEKQLAEIDV